MAQKEVILSRLEAPLAAAMLAGCEHLDPAGLCEAGDIPAMTQAGQCFAATTPQGQAVYVLQVKNGIAWVDACKGTGPVQWSALLLPVIEAQAAGLAAVAFQTKRAGLIRQATKQGYTIAGVILRKQLP